MPESPDRVRFGAAYYFEYGPDERLDVDLDLMAEARIDPVVGEKTDGFGTWALQGYADACGRHGLSPITSMAEPTTECTTAAALRLLDPARVSAIIAPQERSVIGVRVTPW